MASARNPSLRVAVLAPMPPELRPLVRPLALRRRGGRDEDLYDGALGRVEVIAARTGIGPARARQATERVLDTAPVDHVVVVGIAGGIGANVAIGDLVVPDRVLDLASGADHRPARLGVTAPRGVLVTSDGLLTDRAAFSGLERRGVIAIDMETAAVAAVCEARGVPWSVFRGLSDRADDGSVDEAVFGLTRPDGSADLGAVARLLRTQPGRIPRLVELARGMRRAARVAADAAVAAIRAL